MDGMNSKLALGDSANGQRRIQRPMQNLLITEWMVSSVNLCVPCGEAFDSLANKRLLRRLPSTSL
jgi:hypothetical protein